MSKPRQRKLRALNTLTDRQLYALLVRVETLLLDRPPDGVDGADMAVELVRRDEARLVALYRALPPQRRSECLVLLERMRSDSCHP